MEIGPGEALVHSMTKQISRDSLSQIMYDMMCMITELFLYQFFLLQITKLNLPLLCTVPEHTKKKFF